MGTSSGDRPGTKDVRGQDLSLEVTHLQLFLIAMGKLMGGKSHVNWWKFGSGGLRMGMLTCQDKPLFLPVCTGRSRKSSLQVGMRKSSKLHMRDRIHRQPEPCLSCLPPRSRSAVPAVCPRRAGWASGRCTGRCRGWRRKPGCPTASKTHFTWGASLLL